MYNLWLAWVLWGIISQPYVHGVQANKLPDGGEGIGLAFLGRAQLQPAVVRRGQLRVT